MKKYTNFILSLILTMFFVILPTTVKAEENQLLPDPGTYVFTMESGHQEQQYYDEYGDTVTIAVDSSPALTRSVSSGERKISFSSTLENVYYNIYISNNRISSAYNGHYNVFGYTVNNSVLSVDSSSQATYSLYCSTLSISSFVKVLRVNISGDNLVVTFTKLWNRYFWRYNIDIANYYQEYI